MRFNIGKKTKHGAYSTLMAFAVIAVLVAVNLVADSLDIKFDMTDNSIYTITQRSKDIINKIDEDITIYTTFKTGDESSYIFIYSQILDQFKTANIKVENRDPYTNKAFMDEVTKGGTTLEPDSVIVRSAKRTKIIQSSSFVKQEPNYTTGEYETAIDLEPKVTNAIVYVTQTESPVIYALAGYGGIELDEQYLSVLDDANYAVMPLELSKTTAVPDDCKALLFTTPEVDISKEDVDKILAYLQGGGRAMFMVDYTPNDYPNLNALMSAYGVKFGNYYIVEGDTNNHHPMSSYYIYPNLQPHQSTDYTIQKGRRNLLYGSRGIESEGVRRNSVEITPLMVTSRLAFGKNDPNATSPNKEEGDASGPFNVAVAVTDTLYIGETYKTTKLILAGSTAFIDSEFDDVVYGSNSEFLINSLNWLTDKSEEDSVYIKPKSLSDETYLDMTQSEALYTKVFAMAILPAVIIGLGLFIWIRRRSK